MHYTCLISKYCHNIFSGGVQNWHLRHFPSDIGVWFWSGTSTKPRSADWVRTHHWCREAKQRSHTEWTGKVEAGECSAGGVRKEVSVKDVLKGRGLYLEDRPKVQDLEMRKRNYNYFKGCVINGNILYVHDLKVDNVAFEYMYLYIKCTVLTL